MTKKDTEICYTVEYGSRAPDLEDNLRNWEMRLQILDDKKEEMLYMTVHRRKSLLHFALGAVLGSAWVLPQVRILRKPAPIRSLRRRR